MQMKTLVLVIAGAASLVLRAVELKTHFEQPGPWKVSVAKETLAPDLEEFTLHLTSDVEARPPCFDAFFECSSADAHNLWVPIYEENERSRLYAREWGETRYRSAIGSNYPIACAFNEAGDNKLTVAASDCLREIRYAITSDSNVSRLVTKYRFFSVVEAPRRDYTVCLRVDRRTNVFYADAIAEATRWVERAGGYEPCRVPEAAFDPLYSSWYAFWQDVHDRDLEIEAAEAAKLGMKSMILDDGWQKVKSKSYYSATGDWMPVKDRFPDFRAHVDKVHAAGIRNYLLWLSVPFVGNESKAYARFKGKYLSDGETSILDPRFPEVRRYLIETYVRCVRDWDFDGLKLDFIDAIRYGGKDPAEADNWAGRDYRTVPEAIDRLMKDVRAAVTAVKPEALIEFRQRYTGPAIRQYGNLLRATDCPGDLVGNRRRIADLRIASGDTAVHADMLLWSRDDTPEDAARVILNAIFGVVQYSMRLRGLSDAHRRVIRHWIEFAEKHRETLLKGRFRPYHPELMYPQIEAIGDSERIVAVYAEDQVVKAAKGATLYVLNAAHGGRVLLDLGTDLRIRSAEPVACDGMAGPAVPVADLSAGGVVPVAVPVGGYVKLTF